MRHILMLSAAFAALSLAPAFAGDNSDIEQVVVTATRTEQPAAKTGESISVITDQDLQATQKNVVSDALAQTPGVIIVRGGGV
ncbi:MAG TPA: TonB-dependent receptor plug domain-containing protein, partial [Rhizomicrobium sp.]|nr:TonB-dependent receptor plug domain-containing protein [Rhizomicrobium sp.]